MITKPQLNALSYKQLLDLQDRVAEMLVDREAEEKAEMKRKLEELAASSGFDLSELIGNGRRKASKRGKVAPKYRHPKDASLTWSGRGRQPRWLVAELKKGRKIESFLIK